MNVIATYSRLLASHPIITKAVTSSILAGAGDICAQKFFPNEPNKPFDWNRHFRMLTVGFGFAVLTHEWFKILPKIFPGEGGTVLFKKVALDQVFYTPFLDVILYFSLSFMENPHARQPDAGIQKTKECLWPTLRANYMVWPLLQFINFKFIPQQFQVLYMNVFIFFWNIFLSKIANGGLKKKE
ncbi:hypothetical protein WA158_007703 [Blastocystis sp. Blastoise]